MRRKHVLVGVGISLLVTVGIVWIISNPLSRLNHQTRCPDCNIILFSVDTLRADHLGIYGYQRPTSPNIDHFFASRVVFKDCYATSSWTLPSHVSMLTGLYSKNHGAFCRACQLSDTKTTMADVLHKEGYATAAFTGGGFVSKSFNYHTFDVFNDVGNIDGRNFGDMLGWVSGHADDRFFLFWHDFAVHCPYDPSPKFDRFSDPNYSGVVDVRPDTSLKFPGGGGRSEQAALQNKCGTYFETIKSQMDKADVQHVIHKYDGGILTVDDRFAKLVGLLEKKKLLDKTDMGQFRPYSSST